MTGEIEVVNYTENEDGTGNLEVKVDKKAQEMLFDLGMQMILLCATFEVTTDELIKKIIEVYEDDHVQT
jgi:hypothetical protein